MSTLDDFFRDGSADNGPVCSFCGSIEGELVVGVSDAYSPTHWHHKTMTKQELIAAVEKLIQTPSTKDFTSLEDWVTEGDTDDMTPQEIAQEWDELPAMETDF